jgi:hypothetical protein
MAAALLTNSDQARAETRALLAGVWQFNSALIPDLEGPANDLVAMEQLARVEGATDITVLRNSAVTRTTMETALHALGLRSKPGDWILFYYSGHGAQADAAVKGTADGDLDQFIPLGGFDLDKQDTERFVVDKDFYAWIARYIPRDVQVLMIADTCHSGTMHRSIDSRAFRFTPRLAMRNSASDIRLVARPAPRFPAVLAEATGDGATRSDLPNLIYVGAALDDQLALEASMPVEGAPSRGLLTYSFEQALTARGADGASLAGDLDADGKVTVGELGVYLNTQVRALTGQRQESTAFYATGKEKLALFAAVAPPPPAPPIAPALPAIFAMDAKAGSALGGPGQPWRVAPAMSQADFGWDMAKAIVLRRSGDAVAQNIASAASLRGVIEKWNAVEALRPLLSEAKARVAIGPERNGARYAPNANVTIALQQSADGGGPPLYATIFNLASDGTVQRLYPLADDGDGLLGKPGGLPAFENRAVAPYGADHVVALLTPDNPVAFRALLRGVDNQRAAGQLVAPIKEALSKAAGKGALSIGELYTGK